MEPLTIDDIEDQSANTNDAAFSLEGMPAGVSVIVGSVVPVNEYISAGGGSDVEPGVFDPIPIPGNWYQGGTGSNLPFFGPVSSAATQLEISSGNLYNILLIIAAVGVGVGATIATGSAMIGAFAIGLMMFVGVGAGILGLWVLFVYGILAAGYMVASKSM